MLLRFSVENFLSMRDRQELSLVSTTLKGSHAGLIKADNVPGGSILPGAIIYGANASGKSNLVNALSFVRGAVRYSHSRSEPDSKIPTTPFALNKDAADKPSIFEVDFVQSGIRYHFGFEVTGEEFVSEWLYAFPSGRRQMLYERGRDGKIEFGRSLRGRNRVVADIMRPNSLFMSAARQNNHEDIMEVSRFFDKLTFVSSIFVAGNDLSRRFSKSESIDKRSIEFLRRVNTGVTGYRNVEKEYDAKTREVMLALRSTLSNFTKKANAIPEADLQGSKDIELSHQGDNGEDVFFDIDAESSGTRRLLVLMSHVFKTLDDGNILVIDEIDASLHTQICELIVSYFFDSDLNTNKAQLIATTHDTNLMRAPLLRRDQIWFAEKDGAGATSFFPLSDIQTRQSDNIEKGYLQGRFGAIPFAGSVAELAKGAQE